MRFNAILKTKRVYMLYLLPFVLAVIAFLRFTFGPDDFVVCADSGVISIPFFSMQENPWLKEVGVLALLCLSFIVFFVAVAGRMPVYHSGNTAAGPMNTGNIIDALRAYAEGVAK